MGKTYSKANKYEHPSNKKWRSKVNRKFRKMSKGGLVTGEFPYSLREIEDVWAAPSDGLPRYYKNIEEKYKRR